jgi:hypothetical protein
LVDIIFFFISNLPLYFYFYFYFYFLLLLGVMRNVLLMTSYQPELARTSDDTNKLFVVNLYNFTMGGKKLNNVKILDLSSSNSEM